MILCDGAVGSDYALTQLHIDVRGNT